MKVNILPNHSPMVDNKVRTISIWSPSTSDEAPFRFCDAMAETMVNLLISNNEIYLKPTHNNPLDIENTLSKLQVLISAYVVKEQLRPGLVHVFDYSKVRVIRMEDFKYTSPLMTDSMVLIPEDFNEGYTLKDPVPYLYGIKFEYSKVTTKAVFRAMMTSQKLFRYSDIKTPFGKELAIYLNEGFINDGVPEYLDLDKVTINSYFSFPTMPEGSYEKRTSGINMKLLHEAREKYKNVLTKHSTKKESKEEPEKKPDVVDGQLVDDGMGDVDDMYDADIDGKSDDILLSEISDDLQKWIEEQDKGMIVQINPDVLSEQVKDMYLSNGIIWITPYDKARNFDFESALGNVELCIIYQFDKDEE